MSSAPDLMPLVMGLYGNAMLQVQIWEFHLAGLTLNAGIKTSKPTTPAGVERRNKKSFDRLVHLTQRATATEMRALMRDAPVQVDPQLIEEVGKLIEVRDRLAHRYLREELVDLGPPVRLNPSLEHARQLSAYAGEFSGCSKRIHAETDRVLQARGAIPPEEETELAIREALAALLSAQSRRMNPGND